MKLKDYYKILGVERTASAEQIKKAFHKLLRLYHPDVAPNNQQNKNKFLDVVEAYNVLGNLDNRLQYSITLNQNMLNEELLHKHFEIPGYEPKKAKKKEKKVEYFHINL